MKYALYIILFCCLSLEGCAQNKRASAKSKHKNIESCVEWYRSGDFQKAYACLNDLDDTSLYYYNIKGNTELQLEDYAAAEKSFRRVLALDSLQKNIFVNFSLGQVLWYQNKFLEAYEVLTTIHEANLNLQPTVSRQLDYFLRSASLADSLYNSPRIFDPQSLSNTINTEDDELSISFTHDGEEMMITRRNNQEDIFWSKHKDGDWALPVSMVIINTADNEGGVSISGDGQTLVFTACNHSEGKGGCDIFMSLKSDGHWQEPFPMTGINSRFWDSQPCISNDGSVLIFSSDRPGGQGGRDLWLTVLNSQGQWINPINLGPTVNSVGNEENPFLHLDEHSLYFTSDYHPGFGGKDVFRSQRLQGNQWTRPQNLGYPINSFKDEQGIFVNAKGDEGYFSSNIEGDFNLYRFSMDASIRPSTILLIDLVVMDRADHSVLSNTEIEVYDIENNKVLNKTFTDQSGQFRYLVSSDRPYGVNVRRPGYVMTSAQVDHLDNNRRDTLYLDKLEKLNRPIVLENIFFATGKAELKEASVFELDKLAQFLEENPDMEIQILGHTDNIGQPDDNKVLSQDRANAVVNYLVGKGIEHNRLMAIGKGEEQPIADNNSPEGRAKNRRTEFLIK
ncbi:OmpA family protein [Membranihabitans marinus]|uniref:OmpA family protein n=1 Tax=Membranihabitans marinus TaxID=1227546 RepID=UPI001F2ADB09|nr:OmpA family protein [Membranihabitans marinus]